MSCLFFRVDSWILILFVILNRHASAVRNRISHRNISQLDQCFYLAFLFLARLGLPWRCVIVVACHIPVLFIQGLPQSHDVCLLSVCAVCSEGYGRGASITCHRCDDTKARLLISAGALFSLALLVLLALAVIFLVGGLDAVDSVRQSVSRKLSRGKRSTSRRWRFTPEASFRGRPLPRLGAKIDSLDTTVAPAYDFEVEDSRRAAVGADSSHRTSHRQWSTSNHRRVSPSIGSEPDHEVRAGFDESAMPDHGVWGGVDAPDVTGREARARVDAPGTPGGYATGDVGVSAHGHARRSAVADTGTGAGGGVGEGAGVDGEAAVGGVEAEEGGKKKCCGFGDKVKRLLSRLPLDKLKILVVVWQILTVFSSITGVEFPATYAAFLSWINVVNLDIGNIFSASCLLPTTNFYVRLLVTTLAPLVLATALVITYHLAKSRAGIGRAGVIARRAAWSRHVAAWLLLTFLVRGLFTISRFCLCPFATAQKLMILVPKSINSSFIGQMICMMCMICMICTIIRTIVHGIGLSVREGT